MNRILRAIVAVFFVAVIAVSAISICHDLGKHMRIDMTDRHLYTLSDGTKQILAELKQPITLKLFYAKTAALDGPDQIRYYNTYYTYVKALLEEYQAQSKGKIKLEVIDPRPYTDEELAAIRYGLRRFNITEDESFFFGLVLQTQFGVTKTIDFFTPDRQQFVEYDISYLIDTAVNRQKTRLGVLSSLPVMGDSEYMLQMMKMQGQQGNRKWGIITQLEKQYEVSSVPADTDTIKDVDLLLVIQPKDLPEKTQFAIDQYILKGGRVVICIDPHAIVDMPSQQQQMYGEAYDSSSNLPTLLRAWGLEMPAAQFAGDRTLAVLGSPRAGQRPEKILSIMKMTSSDGCFNQDNPISAQLNEVTAVFPGVLKKLDTDQKGSKLTYTPLLQTTDKGNTWTVSSPYELGNPDYGKIMRDFRDGTKPVCIGYLVTGTFKSAFPDGIEVPVESDNDKSAKDENKDKNAAKEAKTKKVTGLTESQQSSAVAVFADVDMFSDMVAYQRSFFGLAVVGDNSTLLLNTLETLSGSDRLISMRSRGSYERPFTVVEDIENKADAETLDETRAIEAQIKGFEQQLNQEIGSLKGENKNELINQTILQKKKDIELQLRGAEKRLRDIKMQKRVRVEALKERMRNYCTLIGPGIMLIVAVVLGTYRALRRRYYISHASDA